MERLLIAAAIVIVALVVAAALRRRQPDAPTQGSTFALPQQLDRADFDHAEVPWLAVVFSSDTCDACAEAMVKAETLVTDDVAVQEVSWQRSPALHERYAIDTVPAMVIAGADGAVEAAFLGPPPTGELWAAMDAARTRRDA